MHRFEQTSLLLQAAHAATSISSLTVLFHGRVLCFGLLPLSFPLPSNSSCCATCASSISSARVLEFRHLASFGASCMFHLGCSTTAVRATLLALSIAL
eukprot:4523641-Amphidinium_carterae.1